MRVLIADDDGAAAAFLACGLEAQGHQAVRETDGLAAWSIIQDDQFDVVILGVALTTLDSVDLLRRLRETGSDIPVLMLTPLGRITDRVDCLDGGADDYLVKPFALSELIARIGAIVRRRARADRASRMTVGPLEIDLVHREAAYEGKAIGLQPREVHLLEELMRHPGKIISRAMLLETIWGIQFDPRTNLVETHMSRLRTKLMGVGAQGVIETVRGAGYRLYVEGRQ